MLYNPDLPARGDTIDDEGGLSPNEGDVKPKGFLSTHPKQLDDSGFIRYNDFTGMMKGEQESQSTRNLAITQDRAIKHLILVSLLMDKIDEVVVCSKITE